MIHPSKMRPGELKKVRKTKNKLKKNEWVAKLEFVSFPAAGAAKLSTGRGDQEMKLVNKKCCCRATKTNARSQGMTAARERPAKKHEKSLKSRVALQGLHCVSCVLLVSQRILLSVSGFLRWNIIFSRSSTFFQIGGQVHKKQCKNMSFPSLFWARPSQSETPRLQFHTKRHGKIMDLKVHKK